MKQKYKRIDFALSQLKTAMALFISNGDRFSVVVLAGEADTILSQYVKRQKKKNFSQLIAENDNRLNEYKKVGSEINDALCINAFKHLDPGEEEYVDVDDLDACCIAAILKALVNYKILDHLNGGVLTESFRSWIRNNIMFSHYVSSIVRL